MIIETLNSIFSAEFNVDSILAIRQNRSLNNHSWLTQPRYTNALFLITDYPVQYTTADGSSFNATVGDVILLPKNSRYSVHFDIPNGKKSRPYMINFRLLDKDYNEIQLPQTPVKLMHSNGDLSGIFSSAAQFYKNNATAMLKAKTYELIHNIFPLEPKDECLINYINRHYTRSFSIPELAERSNMCEAAYRKKFKELTGFSPIQYINRLKVEKSCELLLSHELSTADIAEFLNFCSISYFYRTFKEIIGQTPQEYVATHTEK